MDYDTKLEVKIAIKKLHFRLVTLWKGSGYDSLFKGVNFFAIDLQVELNEDQFLDTCLTVFNKAIETNPEWNNSSHIQRFAFR